jgi:undecaprenyl phosphate N,N'-diacetylbacillosamine 1-phosphate transferase
MKWVRTQMYQTYVKRLLDFFIAAMGLIVTSPILLFFIVALTIQNKGSSFFLQERPGRWEKPFRIIKFKTMTDEKDTEGNLLPDMKRITRLGRIVRKLSIDELPQLVNVLKGEMSLIGPRPLLFKYIPLYSSEQKRRHNVRPGITGYAQVNGRNSISWTKKFEYDIYYVDHVSFKLDLEIILKTIVKVVKKEGINQTDSRPMQPFTGKN